MNVNELIAAINDGTYDENLKAVYVTDKAVEEQKPRYVETLNDFGELFGYDREVNIMSAPGRTEVCGNHTDHNNGKVLAASINLDAIAVVSKNDDNIIRVKSKGHKMNVVDLSDLEPKKENFGDSTTLVQGVAAGIKDLGYEISGFDACTTSDVMGGSGLSSSAAVTIAFISALCRVNDIKPSQEEIIQIALSAEVNYVGVSVGKLDQSCEVYCRADQLLYLDTQDDSYELITASEDMKPWKIGIFFSGLERNLASSKYNMRVDEVRSAAYALKAYAGMEYGKFRQTFLREVPYDVFLSFSDRLPETFRKRAQHFYSEQERVEQGVQAWRKGDIDAFGDAIRRSGASSINNWETGSEELKALSEIILRQDGVYGARFSGAGFKGCCMALFDPSFEESIESNVRRDYLKLFPALSDKYLFCSCLSADGIELV